MRNNLPTIGIIGGKGKMGNWFRNFFKGQNLKVIISDLDTKLTNKKLAQMADIIIISVPISQTVKVIEEIRDFVRPDALLSDITSVKSEPIKAMKKASSGVLGMHPLFGPLVQNLEGQTIVFCPIRENSWIKFLKRLFKQNGAKVVEMEPSEHDQQMAIIQGLIHFTNINLTRVIYSQKFVLKSSFFTPIFRLQSLILGRILSSDPRLYAELEIANPYFLKILKDFQKKVADLAEDVENKDYQNFIKKFKQAAAPLGGFKKTAQIKSSELLRIIERHPVKIKEITKIIPLSQKKVGFLGPWGTFSHEATKKVFPRNKIVPLTTIREIFEAVNNQEVDIGIVPAENSTTGVVAETINCLIEYPLYVSGSFDFRIHHYLLGRTFRLKDLKIIKSHPQALAQCGNWLAKHLPYAKLLSTKSSTASILKTKNKEIGFIAPRVAASIYRLKILASQIEDQKNNFTKFYLLTRDLDKEIKTILGCKKTLLLLAVYDRVGILRDILNVFAQENLNLTSLHSVPSRLKPWDYFFFLEIEVDFLSSKIKKVLKSLEEYCPIIRVIGSS